VFSFQFSKKAACFSNLLVHRKRPAGKICEPSPSTEIDEHHAVTAAFGLTSRRQGGGKISLRVHIQGAPRN
jgi:hypothetical protein